MATATPDSNLLFIPPLAHTPSHAHAGHAVQFYTDDDFLVNVLSRFIGGALAAGDAAVVVATVSHYRELEKRLSERGLDIAQAALQGRYVRLDASETLLRFMSTARWMRVQ